MGLKGKHIIIGVTGGIAAYKVATLIRLLVRDGAEVRVIMTESAKAFITPLTLATLSKNPIGVEFYNPENGDWNSHVSYGIWGDMMVVAPATANTLAKMAAGVADNLLLTTYLSAKCPVMVAPAMDLDMYAHGATGRSLETLRGDGVMIVEAEEGELASGLSGRGRMAEPETIEERIKDYFETHDVESSKSHETSGSAKEVTVGGSKGSEVLKDFEGRRVLVSAGPTYEKIDAVRFIGNFSSGKMGFAIADEFARRGAEVCIVSGPVAVESECEGVERVDVVSAKEMYDEMMKRCEWADVVVSCAAVSDFAPDMVVEGKLKRENGALNLNLKPTRDIAAEIGKRRRKEQVIVGFALETDDGKESALRKMEEKSLDLIVLNSLSDKGGCFGSDFNKVTLIDSSGMEIETAMKPKSDVAVDVVNKVKQIYNER